MQFEALAPRKLPDYMAVIEGKPLQCSTTRGEQMARSFTGFRQMATLDTTTVFAQAKGNRFARVLSVLAARIVAWNDARKTRIALMALSDHELNDIGLSYADIDAVAKGRALR